MGPESRREIHFMFHRLLMHMGWRPWYTALHRILRRKCSFKGGVFFILEHSRFESFSLGILSEEAEGERCVTTVTVVCSVVCIPGGGCRSSAHLQRPDSEPALSQGLRAGTWFHKLRAHSRGLRGVDLRGGQTLHSKKVIVQVTNGQI